MHIDAYSFGRIVINGTEHRTDVLIYADRVDASWWRKEGHRLDIGDLSEILQAHPGILVVGTGYFGMMSVPESTIKHVQACGSEIRIERTGKAVALFNMLKRGTGRTLAAFHITC